MKLKQFFLTHVWLYFIALFFLSLTIYSLHVYKVKSILWGDTRYYYSYTRSLAIDHDLNFDNEAFLPNVGFPNPPLFSPTTSRVTNKFSPGSPLLWLPAFIAGEGLTMGLKFVTHQSALAGYGWLTLWTVGASTVLFSVFGLFLFYLAIREKFGEKIALITSTILFLTTQLFFYTAVDPFNSHSASFAISAALFYLSAKWLVGEKKITFLQVGRLGLVAGLLALIRNQDVVFCVPLGLMILLQSKEYIRNFFKALFFSIAAFLPLLIQLNFTYYLYGQLNSGYTLGGEKFYWLHPDFIRIFLSSGNGFLFFAPIIFFCTWGILTAARGGNRLAQVGLVAFLLNAYIIASWAPEILGGPYGSRMFTSDLPWLGYGAAVLLQKYWSEKTNRYWILLLIFVCMINTMWQTIYMLLHH